MPYSQDPFLNVFHDYRRIGELQHIDEGCNFLDILDEIGNYTTHIMSCIIELCGKTGINSPALLQTLEDDSIELRYIRL